MSIVVAVVITAVIVGLAAYAIGRRGAERRLEWQRLAVDQAAAQVRSDRQTLDAQKAMFDMAAMAVTMMRDRTAD